MLSLIQKAGAQGAQFSDIDFSLCGILNLAITVVFWIGVGLSIVFIVLGGIKYMSSQGDPKATDAARKTLTNAIIGFVIVVGALAIRKLAATLLGIDDLSQCDDEVIRNSVTGTF